MHYTQPPLFFSLSKGTHMERCWIRANGKVGTLHQANVRQFLAGEPDDQRATVADWFAATAWKPVLQRGRVEDFYRMCRVVDAFLPSFRASLESGKYRRETTAAAAALSHLWQNQNLFFPYFDP